ncbi:ArnT family glycosyltransferase [Neorhodopirellula lusitana]|uniref:ArnT family glycosyltransferase n=1 Tax=Neorhodopirellula lusitana TaxID=445327 RepID=UPI00384E2845
MSKEPALGDRDGIVESHDGTGCDRSRWQLAWVVLPILVYVVLRLPILVHAPGGQDEQWFAIPGWTVWTEGVPRIPYVPTRDRSTFFENADRCLMTLPPALFYVQAPFHAVFSPGYATSRIPLFLGALASIALTFWLARRLGASFASALLVSMLMAFCRPLMFTGLMVRPDLLCAFCGWLSLCSLGSFLRSANRTEGLLWRYVFASGAACGLAALFHPFALVFAIQAGVGLLFVRGMPIGGGLLLESGLSRAVGRWRDKVFAFAAFGISCAAVVGLWIPLIRRFPYEFRSQFFANVLDRAGPGLPARMIWPFPALRHHATLLWEFAGPWQCGIFAFAIVLVTWALLKRRSGDEALGGVPDGPRLPSNLAYGYLALMWSSVFLTAVVAGLHPTKGYWVYPCFWIFGGLAIAIDELIWQANIRPVMRKTAFVLVAVVGTCCMLPGAGLRSAWLYTANWGDPRYHGAKFIEGVLDELPSEGLFLADLSYVYDVYLSGRQVLLCQEREQYWGDQPLEYEALLLAWEGEDAGWASQYDGRLIKRFGSRDLPQTCFVDLYQSDASKFRADASK